MTATATRRTATKDSAAEYVDTFGGPVENTITEKRERILSMSTPVQRRAKRRQIMAGFPWVGVFETPEQAREYVNQERIRCLLCGKYFKSLGYHINKIHGYDETSYKQRYGIPYGVGLVGTVTAKKHAEVCRKTLSDHGTNAVIMARIARAAKLGMDVHFRPLCSSVLKQRTDRILGRYR